MSFLKIFSVVQRTKNDAKAKMNWNNLTDLGQLDEIITFKRNQLPF
jgi:hypothetical protein